jgi:FkbM family methyltransferase
MSDFPQPVDLDAYLSRPSDAEPELRRLFGRDEALVIFDIGACEGEESIRYTRRFPKARIHAFEALPANQNIIRRNFARYGIDTAELVPLALADHDGQATFHVSSGRPPDLFAGEAWNYGNKSSSLLPPADPAAMLGWIEFKETVTVTCEMLDTYCARKAVDRIDFIHMDVQGAEALVLRGARRMLPRVRSIWMEVASKEIYRGQVLRDELDTVMLSHGFACTYESNRGDEGDRLYVNRRTWLGRRRLALLALESAARRVRHAAGTAKRALIDRRPPLNPK